MAISIERLQEMLNSEQQVLDGKRKSLLTEDGWWRLKSYPIDEGERIDEASCESKIDLLQSLIKEASPETS